MNSAPKGERLIITIIGRTNVGKSSLINALTGQDIAIVSNFAGTTTDPVKKNYELLPIGPVSIFDTAGIDDTGELGELRIKATNKVIYRSDVIVLVTDDKGLNKYEFELIEKLKKINISFIIAFNKMDNHIIKDEDIDFCKNNNIKWINISSKNDTNIELLKEMIIDIIPDYFKAEKVIVSDLIKGGDIVLLIVPIDLAAPKGRLILPQVEVIREILDSDAVAMVVKEREIQSALEKLNTKPALVITDSQVVLKVAGDIDDDIPFTTFSTLFARYKGDIDVLIKGANKIDELKDGDRILIAEACSHHVQSDDIGTVKIPRWIRQYSGKQLEFEKFSGNDFPEDVEKYALVVHCGSCMLTSLEFKRRLRECELKNIPITNYGVCISKVHGVLERVIRPFYKTN